MLLLRSGLAFGAAMGGALVADTLSNTVMEIVDDAGGGHAVVNPESD
jgi:hypothetical protein